MYCIDNQCIFFGFDINKNNNINNSNNNNTVHHHQYTVNNHCFSLNEQGTLKNRKYLNVPYAL